MATSNDTRPPDRIALLLRPMMPPQSDYHALHARALYIERGLPFSVPFPRSSHGVTVQRDNGTLAYLDDTEVTAIGVTVLATEYRLIVRELRQERRWVWHPGRGLARERWAATGLVRAAGREHDAASSLRRLHWAWVRKPTPGSSVCGAGRAGRP